ncbi:uncharacterized protein C9orf85 homolog [Pyrus x bretschneideri]|uniref:uncharacterized protein C9orf85 homolog n=1 Tax=Pyrus x bretschneideri TaxID=225117 RepID=UPI00202DDD51|nr:uncharacterized protein C9orf85 homolog [Pyrus x bretschneideri]
MMSGGRHQNKFAWKPKLGVKINETEVGGRFRPVSKITGVCQRWKEQIEWRRRYGKYKTLTEPAKCLRCTKRPVRQPHHKLCAACAKEQSVCAKCCSRIEQIVGKDLAEVESEQKKLQEAIKNARERYRRSLLRAMNAGKSMGVATAASEKGDKAGDLFPSASLEEYAEASRYDEDNDIDDGEGGSLRA